MAFPNDETQQAWEEIGAGLRPSDFNTALIHYYRAEITRANVARTRLDNTTNWAVITTGAALSFTFSTESSTPIVIILDAILALLFLFIEARRYRYYELWSYRVRLMETHYFARLMTPPFKADPTWLSQLTDTMLHPRFPVGLLEAFGRRYRRNYAPLFWILGLGWVIKIAVHPDMVRNWNEFIGRAVIGPIPGEYVILIGVLFHGILNVLGLATVALRKSQGEVFDEPSNWLLRIPHRVRDIFWEVFEIDVRPFIPRLQKHDQLLYIITDQAEPIAAKVMEEIRRGITRMAGTGMYTGKPHTILFCVCDATQTAKIKEIVKQIDAHAFVIVTDVRGVHGRGFRPLEA